MSPELREKEKFAEGKREREITIRTALNLLAELEDDEQIAKSTGLTVKYVKDLRKAWEIGRAVANEEAVNDFLDMLDLLYELDDEQIAERINVSINAVQNFRQIFENTTRIERKRIVKAFLASLNLETDEELAERIELTVDEIELLKARIRKAVF